VKHLLQNITLLSVELFESQREFVKRRESTDGAAVIPNVGVPILPTWIANSVQGVKKNCVRAETLLASCMLAAGRERFPIFIPSPKGTYMPAKKNSKKNVQVDEVEDDELVEDDDSEDGKVIKPKLVGGFLRMWPREIFTTPAESTGQRGKTPMIARTISQLNEPGVYILYRDDKPHYVGQATNLRKRLRSHANSVGSLRGYFWNYFSVFVVRDQSQMDEVEAILIAAMPSVITNGAKPNLPRVPMNAATRTLIRERRKKGDF
jgi:predicted GIY-YIG superfamily endonuclease